ncbi:peptidase S9A prolyl oligopeptidase domain protein beta-propeller [Planoprotostelium fungivorum]|uniref:Prolyl endopeptidase-like n=1 Tax=Planoprotostelium fungivorum TaxID=1890364 RepID=A0A2P6N9M3_9EUKA|nr:peptidase S9A prolyl oligopeptidase domain protein beta-propeller [Planoprotostelium fungivorum]
MGRIHRRSGQQDGLICSYILSSNVLELLNTATRAFEKHHHLMFIKKTLHRNPSNSKSSREVTLGVEMPLRKRATTSPLELPTTGDDNVEQKGTLSRKVSFIAPKEEPITTTPEPFVEDHTRILDEDTYKNIVGNVNEPMKSNEWRPHLIFEDPMYDCVNDKLYSKVSLNLASLLSAINLQRPIITRANRVNIKVSSIRQFTMTAKAPIAEKIPHTHEYHGQKYVDNYHWLRDDKRENQKILDHIKKENEYSESVMEQWKPLQEKLYQEYLSRIQEDDETVPHKELATDGGIYYYYTRTIKGQNYSLQCRKTGHLQAEEEILLDLNLDKEHKYIELGTFEPSPSHRLIAFAIDYSGHEDYLVQFKDLKSGNLLEDKIPDCTGEIVWSNDDREVLYVKMDESHRPHQVWKHTLGTAISEDKLLFEESDGKFNVNIYKSSTEKFAFIKSDSSKTSEAHYLPADDFSVKLSVLQNRISDVLYSVDHYGGQFIIRTNGGGSASKVEKFKNFRLAAVAADGKSDTSIENWSHIFYDENVYLTSISTFKNFLVTSERRSGTRGLRVFSPSGNDDVTFSTANRPISFQEEDYDVAVRHLNYHDNILRIQYTSWITPPTVIDITLENGQQEVKKENPVPNYDKSKYESKVIWSTSEDGVRVPITLTYKKELYREEGGNPCLLYGYGSYGIPMDPRFTVTMFSLLDRGFVYAVAKGRAWYEDEGKFLKKKNTFTDFISAGRYLVSQNITRPDLMAMSGASAGGLLMGAVLNLAPDLCKAYVANVPFVDVINTMWDESIPLTTGEFEEWGNPKDKEYFDYMLSYSPYNNVKTGVQYPHGRVTAGLWDPRVAYWEPTKWVAKMRELGVTRGEAGENILIYDCLMGAGHFASTGRYDYLKDKAKDMAFIIGVITPSQSRKFELVSYYSSSFDFSRYICWPMKEEELTEKIEKDPQNGPKIV